MADVVVIGAGICGLGTAMLLARDGHEVTVLERCGAEPPDDPADGWDSWSRKGIAQFRQPHFFMPGLRLLLEAELPNVVEALVAAGAARVDMLKPLPPPLAGQPAQPGDERFWTYTCRRPAGERAFLNAAARQGGIEIRRGVKVEELTTGAGARPGTPHVTGVRTAEGETIRADLVVDAGGRGSRAVEWLAAAGAVPPFEQAADCNFTYSSRYFRGTRPKGLGPLVAEMGSLSILTLPGEADSWSITLFASSADRALKAVRDPEVWTRVVAAHPLQAHWLDGEPITDIMMMGGVVDRKRSFLVDGAPVATGFVAVADAFACTNPSAGRGMTTGMKQARLLRDMLRQSGDDPWDFSLEFQLASEREVAPWYEAQISVDRARFAEMEAERGEASAAPPDPLAADLQLLSSVMAIDPDVFRLGVEFISTLTPLQEIMARPGVRERIEGLAREAGNSAGPGFPRPSREQLLALVSQ